MKHPDLEHNSEAVLGFGFVSLSVDGETDISHSELNYKWRESVMHQLVGSGGASLWLKMYFSMKIIEISSDMSCICTYA